MDAPPADIPVSAPQGAEAGAPGSAEQQAYSGDYAEYWAAYYRQMAAYYYQQQGAEGYAGYQGAEGYDQYQQGGDYNQYQSTVLKCFVSNLPLDYNQPDLSTMQPSHTVWVGNLPIGTTEQELRNLFGGFGEIENVKLLHEKNCAFIRFGEIGEAIDAHTKMQGRFIGGQQLKMGWGKPDENKDDSPPPCKNLWLGNIGKCISYKFNPNQAKILLNSKLRSFFNRLVQLKESESCLPRDVLSLLFPL